MTRTGKALSRSAGRGGSSAFSSPPRGDAARARSRRPKSPRPREVQKPSYRLYEHVPLQQHQPPGPQGGSGGAADAQPGSGPLGRSGPGHGTFSTRRIFYDPDSIFWMPMKKTLCLRPRPGPRRPRPGRD
ncbi:MAG: hypothetical protein MZV64_32760 [Ignavibacteriales bacterium]|nr:hypothetical protein [Ignavibacteriales bacterium]